MNSSRETIAVTNPDILADFRVLINNSISIYINWASLVGSCKQKKINISLIRYANRNINNLINYSEVYVRISAEERLEKQFRENVSIELPTQLLIMGIREIKKEEKKTFFTALS